MHVYVYWCCTQYNQNILDSDFHCSMHAWVIKMSNKTESSCLQSLKLSVIAHSCYHCFDWSMIKMKLKFLAAISVFTLLATITAANFPCTPRATREIARDVTIGRCANEFEGECCLHDMDYYEYSAWSRGVQGPPNPVLYHFDCHHCVGLPLPYVWNHGPAAGGPWNDRRFWIMNDTCTC